MKTPKFPPIAALFVTSTLIFAQWAAAGIAVVGSMTHIIKVTPGSVHEGTITVSNISDKTEVAEIELSDYEFFADGTQKRPETGSVARSNGPWISFSPRRLILPPNGISEVSFKIDVPAEASLEGTYWSVLFITGEPGQPIPAEIEGDNSSGLKMAITQTVSYGIQIVTHIGDSGSRELFFADTRLANEGDKTILEIDVENHGQRWLRPTAWIELYTADGERVANIQLGRRRTYPGTSVRFRGDLSLVPAGAYSVLVIADCGDDNIFGARHDVTIEE